MNTLSKELSQYHYRRLAGEINGIIHSAAITDFSCGPDELRKVNQNGTQQIIELARAAQVPLYYISTAFVYPFSHGEESFEFRAYELSKR